MRIRSGACWCLGQEHGHEGGHGGKLTLIKSPVVGAEKARRSDVQRDRSNVNLGALGYGDGLDHETPEFERV